MTELQDPIEFNIINYNNNQISGGNIDTSSLLFYYIAIAIIVIFTIWLIVKILKRIKINGEDYYQRKTRLSFNKVQGEDYNKFAKDTIQYGELIENPNAIDHYRVGTVYLLNAKNYHSAFRHFNQALDEIIDGKVDLTETPFIINRIDDLNHIFMDTNIEETLPIQQALLTYYQNTKKQISEKPTTNIISKDDPEFKQKMILSRQNWQSDSQNVHDSAIYNELLEQVNEVMCQNRQIPDYELHNYDEVINWLRVRYRDTPEKYKVEKVIALLNNDYPISILNGISERTLITAIWQRSYDEINENNAGSIREALGDAVLDCVEGDYVVCITGRSSKLWQSLALLDANPKIGILKTKQAIRNEIFDKAAKVVNDFVGINGSASESLKLAYLEDENSEQVIELKEVMKQKIKNIGKDYVNLLPQDQIDIIILECLSII
jgi:tetratricopeptide (TPR) repeat protein